jgi:cytochrome P450
LKATIAQGRPFDVSRDITMFSFDAILSVASGLPETGGDLSLQLEHLHNSDVARRGTATNVDLDNPVELPRAEPSAHLAALLVDEETLWKGFYMPWPKLYHRINKLRPSVRAAGEVLRSYLQRRTQKAITNQEQGLLPRSALEYIIQREIKAADKAGRKPALDDPRIRDGIYGYLIAGHDTSAGSLAWAVRRLVMHREEQVKLQNSLKQTYTAAWAERRLPTAAELMKTPPYLDALIEEVLRLDCPVVTIAIATRRDTTILAHGVPKDTPVFLNLTGPSLTTPSIAIQDGSRNKTSRLQGHHRANWDDLQPEAFRPERWLETDQNGETTFNPGSGPSLSFSAGDRGCWGKRLGYLQLKIVVALLVWSFDFVEIPEKLALLEIHDSLVTAPKHCFLRLSRRT